jgi:hypothetical protein
MLETLPRKRHPKNRIPWITDDQRFVISQHGEGWAVGARSTKVNSALALTSQKLLLEAQLTVFNHGSGYLPTKTFPTRKAAFQTLQAVLSQAGYPPPTRFIQLPSPYRVAELEEFQITRTLAGWRLEATGYAYLRLSGRARERCGVQSFSQILDFEQRRQYGQACMELVSQTGDAWEYLWEVLYPSRKAALFEFTQAYACFIVDYAAICESFGIAVGDDYLDGLE